MSFVRLIKRTVKISVKVQMFIDAFLMIGINNLITPIANPINEVINKIANAVMMFNFLIVNNCFFYKVLYEMYFSNLLLNLLKIQIL